MAKKTILFIFSILLSVTLFADDGKIVFSKSPIDAATGETLPPATFEIGDKIYCRVYLPKSLNKYKNQGGDKAKGVDVRAFLNGKQYNNVSLFYYNTVEEASVTTFEFVFNDQKDKVNAEFIADLNNLQNGSHKVTVKVVTKRYTEKEYVAQGEFTYIKSASSKAALGKSFNDIKAGMVDPAIEAEALKILKEYKAVPGSRPYVRPNLKSDKIIILSKDWGMTRHPKTGVITHRYIYVAVKNENKENGTCNATVYSLFQNYTGSDFQKTFTEASIHSSYDLLGASPYVVDCD